MASSKVMASSKPMNSDLSGSPSSTRSRRPTTSTATATTSTSSSSSRNQLPQLIQNVRHHPPPSNLVSRMPVTVDGMLRNPYDDAAPPNNDNDNSDSTLLDAQITLIEAPVEAAAITSVNNFDTDAAGYISNGNGDESVVGYGNGVESGGGGSGKTVEEVWREIVAGRREKKEEEDNEEMMTLEDFLAKAGAVDGGEEGEDEVKMPPPLGAAEVFGFDPVVVGESGGAQSAFHLLDRVEGAIVGFGNGVEVVGGGGGGGGVRGGKRGRAAVAGLMEPLDKAAQQRQRRMIKNRESAARSRERKQAYQVELESQAVRLEEENERLLKEKEERTKERFQLLMEKVIPVVEKRRPPCALRRVCSLQW